MKNRLERIINRSRWLKAIPNTLTLFNSLCGFAAILLTLQVYNRGTPPNPVFATSALIILSAMIFDALDGFAARILDAASMHGIQMDSLADMVTFGVAPATVVAIMTHSCRELNRHQEIAVYLLCSVYLGGAALRLATYNVHAILNQKTGDEFTGLPSPGAAAAICSVVIFAVYSSVSPIPIEQLLRVLPAYAALLGLLMISNIPYIHLGKWLLAARRSRRQQIWLLLMLAAVALFRADGLLMLVTIYVLSGPVMHIIHLLQRQRPPDRGGKGTV